MVEKIYIARHGFRLNWVTSSWKSATGLPRDPPLAAYGNTQAEELASFFLSLPEEDRPTIIFSSPYYRCLQTSQPVASALGIPILIEHGLSEWYSPVIPGTGLHPRPGSAQSLKAYFPEVSSDWNSIWYPSRKGEDVDQLMSRTSGFLQHFLPAVDRTFGRKAKNVLLVSHAATVIALSQSLVREKAKGMRVGCCSLSEFVKSSNDSEWVSLKLADSTHLTNGGEREWGLEDILISDGKVVEDAGEKEFENEADEPLGLFQQPETSSNL